jgi:hypothetical protein
MEHVNASKPIETYLISYYFIATMAVIIFNCKKDHANDGAYVNVAMEGMDVVRY